MKLPGRRIQRALGGIGAKLNGFASRRPGMYLTGGAVRDAIRGVKVHDIDVSVAKGSAVAAGRAFAKTAGGALVVLGKERLVRIHLAGTTVDFTPLRDRTIVLDLKRRDFTVNAMGVALPWGREAEVLDPAGGVVDLKRRRLRTCGKGTFREDPVRLWRAHRAEVELRLKPDAATARLLRTDARRAAECPGERLRDELFKLFALARSAEALQKARASGVLTATFPELEPMARVRVPGRGREIIDVLGHTLEAMGHLDRLLSGLRREFRGDAAEAEAHFRDEPVPGRPRAAVLKLALLFHDVAKPDTVSRTRDGDVHFYGHEMAGARRAAEIMVRRLKCGGAEVDIVSRVIRQHLRPGYLAAAASFTDRAVYRFLRDAGNELYEVLLHGQADRKATHHAKGVSAAAQRRAIDRIMRARREMRKRVPERRLVTGHDLMKELGVKPGPVVGKMLRAVEEGVALGKIGNATEALRAAKRVLDRHKA